jgi:hypothetical protein
VGNGEAMIVPVNHRGAALQKRTATYSMFVAARGGSFFSHLGISADRLAASMLKYTSDFTTIATASAHTTIISSLEYISIGSPFRRGY